MTPGTSIPAERVWSAMGRLYDKLRMSMKPETAEQQYLLFVWDALGLINLNEMK